MQLMLNTDSGSSSSCVSAKAPAIANGSVKFDAAVAGEAGSAPLDIVDPIAAGELAPWGGTIHVEGCKAVLITATYLTGDDCDACTDPDVLVPEEMTWTAWPGSSAIPPGAWTSMTATLLDADGNPVDLAGTMTETVYLHSGFNYGCCEIVVPSGEKKVAEK